VGLLVRRGRLPPLSLSFLPATAAAADTTALVKPAQRLRLPADPARFPVCRQLGGSEAGARAVRQVLGVLRTANGRFCGRLEIAVQLFVDELNDDAGDELCDGAA
jgi:hypothetical protein